MITFEKLVGRLVEVPKAHAQFVNTLSLLEYIGARKILKSQRSESMTNEVLAHAAEEIRHAQTFKKIALKMSAGELETYSDFHLLCGAEAKLYFKTLDSKVEAEFGLDDPWNNYLHTTLLIEERANEVYSFYDSVLAERGFPGVIKGILREEKSHLADITTSIEESPFYNSERMNRLRAVEKAAFDRFMQKSWESLG